MHASRERGAAAVEFALVVPLLMLFLFGIVEGGTRYAQQNEVNHWAYVAARDLSIDPTKSASTIVNTLKGADSTSYAVSAANGCPASPALGQVVVTVSATHTSLTGLFGSYTLEGRGVARCEN
jgi:Flp pilus assembly protein TadG